MTSITTEPTSAFADFIERHLHRARILAQLALNEIDTVDVALAAGWIDGEAALAMLDEAGLGFITGASSE